MKNLEVIYGENTYLIEKEVKNKAYENSFFKKVVGIKNKIKKFLA